MRRLGTGARGRAPQWVDPHHLPRLSLQAMRECHGRAAMRQYSPNDVPMPESNGVIEDISVDEMELGDEELLDREFVLPKHITDLSLIHI